MGNNLHEGKKYSDEKTHKRDHTTYEADVKELKKKKKPHLISGRQNTALFYFRQWSPA